jgi:aryl-alcohol dehydrogenase (NADP+)
MYAWQLCKANYLADLNGWTRFVSMQNHYNIIYREEEREMNPYCKDENISLIPWSPVARGMVCGTRTRIGGTTARSKTDAYGAKKNPYILHQ